MSVHADRDDLLARQGLGFHSGSLDTLVQDTRRLIENVDLPANSSVLRRVVEELHRICKQNAEITVRVPYWNTKCAYNNVTHKSYFNERALKQLFGLGSSYRRAAPPRFDCGSMRLVPSRMCRIVPGPLRYALSIYLCNIIRAIEARFRVVKSVPGPVASVP